MQKSGSIYARLMLAALLPLLAGMAAAFLIASAVFTRTLEDRVREQAEHASAVLTGAELPLTPDLLRRVAELERSEFVLLDREGAVAESSYPVPAELTRLLTDWRTEPPGAHAVAHLRIDGRPSIAVLAPFTAPGDARVSSLVAIASLVDARSAAWRAAGGVALALLLAAVVLAALLRYRIGRITRPLENLAALAESVAAGGRDARVPVAGNDEVSALARAVNNMTERIGVYEAKLAATSRLSALGEMAARIAHEVRNPLTGLKLQLELLAERSAETERPLIRRLLDEVKRLGLIVDTSLMLARDRPARREPVELTPLAADVLALVGPSLSHRNIAVATAYEPTPAVSADPDLIRQALINLLGNAADALPGGGRVLVSTACARSRKRVIVEVADSGPGLAPDLEARLKTGPASTKPYGLGLGLMLCREVAASHGGEFVMRPRGVLGGAAFALELPLPATVSPEM